MMKKDKSVPIILAATFYLVCYVFFLASNATLHLAVLMFALSPIVVIWMVVNVLKQENKSRKTFDEYFYEDVDEKRS